MKKRIIFRGLVGAPISIIIGYLITIMISVAVGDGNFYSAHPALVSAVGSELEAVIIQTLVLLVYGSAWGISSLIWETENWSLLKQTTVHLIVVSTITFPVAYFMRWMDHSILGILLYFGIFFAFYLIIWFIQYSAMKKQIKEMNEKVQEHITFN